MLQLTKIARINERNLEILAMLLENPTDLSRIEMKYNLSHNYVLKLLKSMGFGHKERFSLRDARILTMIKDGESLEQVEQTLGVSSFCVYTVCSNNNVSIFNAKKEAMKDEIERMRNQNLSDGQIRKRLSISRDAFIRYSGNRPVIEKQCKICNKGFNTNYPNKIYCGSKKCAKTAANHLQTMTLICSECGVSFKAKAHHRWRSRKKGHGFCGLFCTNLWRRRNKLERHIEVKTLSRNGLSASDISQKIGLHKVTIWRILREPLDELPPIGWGNNEVLQRIINNTSTSFAKTQIARLLKKTKQDKKMWEQSHPKTGVALE